MKGSDFRYINQATDLLLSLMENGNPFGFFYEHDGTDSNHFRRYFIESEFFADYMYNSDIPWFNADGPSLVY